MGARPGETPRSAPALVRELEEVPAAARALATLARVDYVDGFLLDARSAPARSAEEWARAALEGAPPNLQRSLRWGWTALGLRLDRGGSGDSVLGWALRRSDSDFALLGLDSWIGMPAEVLFKREGDALLFATFVARRNPLAKVIWAVVSPRHRRVVPYLLARAARVAPGAGRR